MPWVFKKFKKKLLAPIKSSSVSYRLLKSTPVLSAPKFFYVFWNSIFRRRSAPFVQWIAADLKSGNATEDLTCSCFSSQFYCPSSTWR
jgi:hypothetical protein